LTLVARVSGVLAARGIALAVIGATALAAHGVARTTAASAHNDSQHRDSSESHP
jgi:hypothetical protein